MSYGPPPAADKKEEKKSKAGGGGDGQPKQMDTRKADKARKVGVLLLVILFPKLVRLLEDSPAASGATEEGVK